MTETAPAEFPPAVAWITIARMPLIGWTERFVVQADQKSRIPGFREVHVRWSASGGKIELVSFWVVWHSGCPFRWCHSACGWCAQRGRFPNALLNACGGRNVKGQQVILLPAAYSFFVDCLTFWPRGRSPAQRGSSAPTNERCSLWSIGGMGVPKRSQVLRASVVDEYRSPLNWVSCFFSVSHKFPLTSIYVKKDRTDCSFGMNQCYTFRCSCRVKQREKV